MLDFFFSLSDFTKTCIVALLVIAPLFVLGRWFRVFPSQLLLVALGVPAALCVPLLFMPAVLAWPVIIAAAAIVVLAALDLLSLPARGAFRMEREMGRTASLDKPHRVRLTLTNFASRTYFADVKDDVSDEMHAEPAEFAVRLPAQRRTTLAYEVRSTRRGAFALSQVYLRVFSLLRLWRRFLDYAAPAELHVYPDMKQLSEYAIFARKNRLNLLGVRRTRRIGQDNEFERLRDYTLDDNFKHIDWRTTARRRKLTVKDFQNTQNQTLVFVVDCGRMMTNQSGGLTLLDHALNSMLMLSYVALERGDSVGLICFSDTVHTCVPAKGGHAQMNRLLHASFDRLPQLVESRYDEAFLYLKSKFRKRSLVIFMTNLIDEVNSNQVERYLTNMVGKHLPLSVWLRDRRLFEAAEQPYPAGDELFRAAAAAEILTWRQQVLSDLSVKGVLSVDAFPEDLTAPLINSYLDVKARHLL